MLVSDFPCNETSPIFSPNLPHSSSSLQLQEYDSVLRNEKKVDMLCNISKKSSKMERYHFTSFFLLKLPSGILALALNGLHVEAMCSIIMGQKEPGFLILAACIQGLNCQSLDFFHVSKNNLAKATVSANLYLLTCTQI